MCLKETYPPPLPITLEYIAKITRNSDPCSLQWVWQKHIPPSELQIIFESNAYLRPNFWLNADFQISKSIFTPCNFSQCWKGRYYCFEVPYLNFFWCNFNYSFGSDLLLLVITLTYILTIFWLYVDKRTDRLTSTIQSFTFVLRHVLTISTHWFGHLLRTAIC